MHLPYILQGIGIGSVICLSALAQELKAAKWLTV